MKRALGGLAVSLFGVFLVGGCPAPAPVVVKRDLPPPPPGPWVQKLEQHQKLVNELPAAQDKAINSLEAYERQKGAYQSAVATAMAGDRKADKRAAKTISEMASDGSRIAKELIESVRQINEALRQRAEASHALLAVEGQLWSLEAQGFGSKEGAAKLAPDEVKAARAATTALEGTRKDQQAALSALRDKELEVWASVGADAGARDKADQELSSLRAALDGAFSKLVDAALQHDEAVDKVHRKLLSLVPPSNQDVRAKMQDAIKKRSEAATTLATARGKLKEATVKEAEQRAQEVGYDGEFNVVLEGAYRKPEHKEQLAMRVRPQRDSASEARVAMRNDEKALGDARKAIVHLEDEVAAMGY